MGPAAAVRWLKSHPVRMGAYLALAIGTICGYFLLRGITAGRRDALVSRVAQWSLVRNWVDSRLELIYSFSALHVARESDCTLHLILDGGEVQSNGILRARVEATDLCLQSVRPLAVRAVTGPVAFGPPDLPEMFTAGRGEVTLRPFSARAEDAAWNARSGPLLTAGAASLSDGAASATSITILPQAGPLAATNNVNLDGIAWTNTEIHAAAVSATGTVVRLIEDSGGDWNWLQAQSVFQNAVADVSELPVRVRALAMRVVPRLLRDLVLLFWIAAALIFGLKLLVTRIPNRWLGRIAVSAAPALLAWLVSGFGMEWAVAAAAGLALLLFIVFYRRAKECHQKWEPALADLLAPLLIVPPCLAHAQLSSVRVPDLSTPLAHFTVGQAGAHDTSIHIDAAACGVGETAALQLADADATEISVTADLRGPQLRELIWERVAAEGTFSSKLLQFGDGVRYIPEHWRRIQPVAFCVVAIPTGASPPPRQCDMPSGSSFGIQAGAAVDWRTGRSELQWRFRHSPLGLHLEGQGEFSFSHVHTDLRTIPGSGPQISRGDLYTSFQPSIDARILLNDLRAERLAIGSAETRARLATPCTFGPSRMETTLSTVSLQSGPGVFSAEAANITLERLNRNTLDLETRLSGAGFRSKPDGPRSLSADLPAVNLKLSGVTSAEDFPRQLTARASLSIWNREGQPVIELRSPIAVRADLWNGDLEMPQQSFRLQQAVTSRIDPSISVNLAASGSLKSISPVLSASIQTRVETGLLRPATPPLELEIHRILARSRWEAHQPGEWDLDVSGVVRLPERPPSLELASIPSLRLTSSGRASEVLRLDDLSHDLEAVGNQARRFFAEIPDSIAFQAALRSGVSGPPSFTAAISGGSVFQGDLETGIRTLLLPNMQLELLETDARGRGLSTRDFGGNMDFDARSSVSESRVQTTITTPLAATIASTGTVLEIRLDHPLDLRPFLTRVHPFLQQAGLPLDGIAASGRLGSFRGKASFSDRRLRAYDFGLGFAPGSRVHLSFRPILRPVIPLYLDALSLALESPLSVQLRATESSFPEATLDLDAPAGKTALNGGTMEAAFGIRTEFSLGPAISGAPSVFRRRAVDMIRGFHPHAIRAFEILAGHPVVLRDLRWDFELENSGETFLDLLPDSYRLRARSKWKNVSARVTERSQAFAVHGQADLDARGSLHQEHLVLELLPDVNLTASWAGGPGRTIRRNSPFHMAAAPNLRPADREAGWLWDPDFYKNFWASYSPLHIPRTAPLLDREELLFGPLALRDLRFPTNALLASVGYQDRIQIHLPLAGRALFGNFDGLIQAALDLRQDSIQTDSRSEFKFWDVQAGAAGRRSGSDPTPLLEDTLEGGVRFETSGFRFHPRLFDIFRADASRVIELDNISFSLDVHRSKTPGLLAGVIPLHTDYHFDFHNDALNQLFAAVQRLTPRGRILRYKDLAFSFQVRNGMVDTRAPLLVLQDVQVPGVFPVNANLRLLWGRPRSGFENRALRLRNLLYLYQRTLPPRMEP